MGELTTCGHRRVLDLEEFNLIEEKIQQAQGRASLVEGELTTYVIPIVFHVLHKGEAIGTGSNISDEQIYSAVSQLNRDFGKEPNTNSDGDGVDMGFRFILANKDDSGNFSTGINRVNGAALSTEYANNGARADYIGESESVFKNWSRWNSQRVINIWVVSEIEGNNGGSGIQAYAYFPTSSYVDGVVNLYNAIGTTGNIKSYTNLSKTLCHEIGHWGALFHTFQGNSCEETNGNIEGDRCSGTPPTIKNSNGNNPACGGTQQVNNHMDYTNQAFRNMFEITQRTRFRLACENSRAAILDSDAADFLSDINASALIEVTAPAKYCCPNSTQYLTVEVHNTSDNPIHKIVFSYSIDSQDFTHNWYGAIPPNETAEINIVKVPTESSSVFTVAMESINDLPSGAWASRTMTIPTEAPYKIEIVQDALMGQISWDITKAGDLTMIYESPNYANFKPNEVITQNICLPKGEYLFTFQDVQAGMQTEGAYLRLIDPEGNILVEETGENGESQYGFTVGYKSADLNGDGVVNILDVSIMNQTFGKSIGDEGYNEKADLNNDGHVNIMDVSILSSQFGK